jgi:hypothetical protein
MQITQPRGEYVEKIIRDTQGRLVRLSFCIFEKGGHIRARILNVTYLEEKTTRDEILFLDSEKRQKNFDSKIVFKSKIVSPYFNFDILKFSGSKPRAPTK